MTGRRIGSDEAILVVSRKGHVDEGTAVTTKAMPADVARLRLTSWVAREIMPHEPAVRRWLSQRRQSPEDIDDLIQEAYAKLASLTAFDQIERPDAFFFQTVRNLMIDGVRRARVVRIDAVGHIAELPGYADDLDPERIAGDRRELTRVLGLIETLPDRCREIFKLRKIDGISQREIAGRLGVSESIVENDGVKGLVLLVRAMRGEPNAKRSAGRMDR